jgi:hypothetical protein
VEKSNKKAFSTSENSAMVIARQNLLLALRHTYWQFKNITKEGKKRRISWKERRNNKICIAI